MRAGFHSIRDWLREKYEGWGSQSLVNEGRFPRNDFVVEVGVNQIQVSRNPSLMRAGFHTMVRFVTFKLT